MSYLHAINYHLYLFEKRCEPASTQPKLRLNEFNFQDYFVYTK